MDVAVGPKYIGRIVFGLYGDDMPLTCENFRQLCKGFRIKDKVIGYRNTLIYFVQPHGRIIGGDIIEGIGTGPGMSLYGPVFPDESWKFHYTQIGDLATFNSGPNTNTSQFMITMHTFATYYYLSL